MKRKKKPSRFTPPADALPGDRFRAGKRLWSPAEDTAMRRNYPNTPTAELAQRLRRPIYSVYQRAANLGLRKSETYLASPAACRLRRGDQVGARFRFPPGHAPANKGLRRPGWHAGRMRETQFKPGARSGRAAEHVMPLGTERLIEGYRYRKVSEIPNVPYTRNWKQVHVLLWEEHHGPVPAGHCVVFRNRDRSDIRLENLELVTRRELMARNTVHNLPKPIVEVVRLRGVLNRKIHQRERAAR